MAGVDRTYDVIIVGSGAAGTFAAWALREKNLDVLIVDVGTRPPDAADSADLDGNWYDLRRSRSLADETIGARYESLHNVENPEITPKVKGPLMRYVVDAHDTIPGICADGFQSLVSYAEGGLANAWGAQVFRFNDEDLRGYPVDQKTLDPYYDTLTRHIGISGADDDLTRHLGTTDGMLPPLELGRIGGDLMNRYRGRRDWFHERGIELGHSRLAVLSVDHAGREKCQYDNLEFFRPRSPAIYSPAFTLRELIEQGQVGYLPGHYVERYDETDHEVRVQSRELTTGERRTLRGRNLILCLGALNTPRLVLFSKGDFRTQLPLLENPTSFTPLVAPRQIGAPVDERSYSSQLGLVYAGPLHDEPIIGMLYSLDGLLRSDLMFNFPLSARGCLTAARYLLPAMTLLQVFYPTDPDDGNHLRVNEKAELVLRYRPAHIGRVERHLLRAFRSLGYLGSTRLTRYTPGASVHYGGSLPMREERAGPYECDPSGLLHGSERVFVGDSASFPRLPAKNLTFTIMANAMRIADGVAARLGPA